MARFIIRSQAQKRGNSEGRSWSNETSGDQLQVRFGEGWTSLPIFHALAFGGWRFESHIRISNLILIRKYKGRTTAGDPSTFASITELQYDRLVKWSEGKFTKHHPKVYTSFDKIPLQEQPAALTKAALEATIGAPLYPGIEMSWNAELSETYQLDTPFTINLDVKPGDLTRFLSLPWQSDFYMCRSYW